MKTFHFVNFLHILLPFFAVFTLIVVLSACGSDNQRTTSSSGSRDVSSSGKKTTIYYYNWSLPEMMEPMNEAFEAIYPDVDVVYVKMADPTTHTGNLLLASGEPIDIISQPTTDDMRMRVVDGLYEAVDPYLAKDGLDYTSLFGQGLAEIETVDGHQYAIPNAYNAVGLLFNKKLFDEAGEPYPTDDWTWDDMRRAAKAVSKPDPANPVYGIVPYYVWNNTDWLYPAVQELGLNFLYKKDGSSNLDHPAFLRSLQLFYDMEMADKSAWPISEYKTLNLNSNPIPGFWQGRAAMMLVPPFAMYFSADKSFGYKGDFEYGWVNMPKAKKDDDLSTIFYTSDFSIPASSQNKDTAWEFIKYTCIDHPEYFAITKGVMPAADFETLAPEVQKNVIDYVIRFPGSDVDSAIKTFITNKPRQISLRSTITAFNAEINAIMATEAENCLLGNQTPAQALARMKEAADRVLGK
jgi:multiple sugar transport system substrate-binding protein